MLPTTASETILAEYEELVKAKEFYFEKKKEPFECTYQAIIKDLSEEYTANLKQKLDRWIDVTNARYFKNAPPVIFFFQAKMLYRDGYYEAAVAVARSICEMICFNLLQTQSHPFGCTQELELENFRTLVNYLAIPKSVNKNNFEDDIAAKIMDINDRNFIKSCYTYEASNKIYQFKTELGKRANTLNKFHAILDAIPFTVKDNFPDQTFKLINDIYTDSNSYVHARTNTNIPKDDSKSILNRLGLVLAHIYNVSNDITERQIVTGYSFFPDICQGHNFALDLYLTEEDAQRGYLNLPSQEQINNVFDLTGEWRGKWRTANGIETLKIRFVVEGEYLNVYLLSNVDSSSTQQLTIKLFGNYFHLILKEENETKAHLELEILDPNTLIGENLLERRKVLFERQTP